jgi:hypothetical protein
MRPLHMPSARRNFTKTWGGLYWTGSDLDRSTLRSLMLVDLEYESTAGIGIAVPESGISLVTYTQDPWLW